MKTLHGLNEVTLLESSDEFMTFLDTLSFEVRIHAGKIYHGDCLIALTLKAYQRLYLDIYP